MMAAAADLAAAMGHADVGERIRDIRKRPVSQAVVSQAVVSQAVASQAAMPPAEARLAAAPPGAPGSMP
jgi:hypothetical protein